MAGKILVVSDSHGNNTGLRKAISNFGERGEMLDMMIHLGDSQCSEEAIRGMVDCPVEMVSGNCDFLPHVPSVKLITIGKERVLLTHGHRYGCKAGLGPMRDLALENNAGVVLFGHTHEPLLEPYAKVKVFNPGSISLPRQEGHRPTYLVITVKEDQDLEYSLVTM